jgi:hypothetical protein
MNAVKDEVGVNETAVKYINVITQSSMDRFIPSGM